MGIVGLSTTIYHQAVRCLVYVLVVVRFMLLPDGQRPTQALCVVCLGWLRLVFGFVPRLKTSRALLWATRAESGTVVWHSHWILCKMEEPTDDNVVGGDFISAVIDRTVPCLNDATFSIHRQVVGYSFRTHSSSLFVWRCSFSLAFSHTSGTHLLEMNGPLGSHGQCLLLPMTSSLLK